MSTTLPTERPVKVLFADDDEDTLALLGRAAKYIGHFDYRLAHDGAEVEFLLNSETFDVLCLDVEMPVAYGTTIAAEIRRMDSGIPIIFFTGRTGREVRATAHQTDATVVTKPAEPGYLMELIGNLAKARSKFHGAERRHMSLNTSQFKRRRTDAKLTLPETLKRATASK